LAASPHRAHHMRSTVILVLASVLLACACTSSAETAPPAFREISWEPARITTGSPCLFRVNLALPASAVHGSWQGRELTFTASPDPLVWFALAGVDVEATPGSYTLEVQAVVSGGAVLRQERTVVVSRAQFPTERLRVPQRFVEPDPETRQRIDADRQLKHAAFAHDAPAEWSGDFRPPVYTAVSEGFGTRRTFNRKLASIHRGLDYHAAPGTPVVAANSGEVVLAQELFYEGNCVIVDHGLGFATIYMHLSQLAVTEGQHVEKGQQVGLSGATGRATGPHLHVAVRWQGAYLDPAQLWGMRLPELHSPSIAAAAKSAP